MAAADEGWPGEHPEAWSTANDAAQRLARATSTIVSNLHQVRVPSPAETQRAWDGAMRWRLTIEEGNHGR